MFGYYLFLGFEKFLMLLPRSWRKQLFFGVAKLARLVSKKHERIVRQNLEFVYGKDLDEAFIEEIIDYGYKNLAINALFIIEARHLSVEKLSEMVTIENLEVVEKVQEQNKPIVFVTGHFGVWELGGSAFSALVTPVLTVYKRMNNPLFEKYVLSSRAHFRLSFAEKHGALKPLIKQVRAKKATGLLIDINVHEREGTVVDFLGKPTRQVTTPAYLAVKLNATLIPALIYTEDFDNFTIKFFSEIDVEHTDDATADITKVTQDVSNWLSEQINKDPKFWFWMHRRWKTDYPELYSKK